MVGDLGSFLLMEKFCEWAHAIVNFFNLIGSVGSVSSDDGAVLELCDVGILWMAVENLK